MDIAGSGYDYVPEDSEVDKCTIIRAAAIAPDGTSSSVITNSYFVGNDMANKYKGATVASLVMDPNDLLDYNTGILALGAYYDEWRKTAEAKQIIQSKAYWNYEGNYTQSGKGWERQATMDYIDPSTGNVEFSAPMGVRLHGGASRMYGQKSFKFYMREEYGQKNLKNPAAIIDANHSNSNKQFKEQIRIVSEVLHSRRYNEDVKKMVKGVMIESYLEEGNQKISDHMTYGKSITDPCLGWEDTEQLIYKIAEEC